MYLYKGFSTLENILLNLAGAFAVGVAMVPCNCCSDVDGPSSRLHAFVAVLFFLSMAAVCLLCAGDTISFLPDQKTRDAFKRRYHVIGILLVASPATAVLVSYVLRQFENYKFFVEAFGVWMFASYWLVKSREFSITSAEKRAVRGQLEKRRGRGVEPAPVRRRREPRLPGRRGRRAGSMTAQSSERDSRSNASEMIRAMSSW
jgi:hypothetical protein